MPVMTQELKDKWLAALRSDAYPQTQGALARVEQGQRCFCALGVLADVLDPGAWEPAPNDCEGRLRHFIASGSGTQHLDTDLVSATAQELIADLNDREGETLRNIAEWVEMNVEVAQ